jgi:hypothetical protein
LFFGEETGKYRSFIVQVYGKSLIKAITNLAQMADRKICGAESRDACFRHNIGKKIIYLGLI